MATLFFEGFDRGTFIRKLDRDYWSTQYYRNPPYAFGGYTYDNDYMSNYEVYTITYQYYSPVGGALPSGGYESANLQFGTPGNAYPGFGQPPGFLALTNRRINDNTDLDPICYMQLSGFPVASGDKTYFGIRSLGIETKHEDYWNEQYPLGRFGHRHPFIAFCNGDVTGCLISVISFTGNNLLPLVTDDPSNNNEGKRISIGLEIEQNGVITGIFDINLSDTLDNYRITPVYCSYSAANIPPSDPCKLLTIAKTTTGPYNTAVVSRWTHFEFEIDNNNGLLKLNIEGVNATVYDEDEEDRDVWEISMPISGFNFDNIRLFNRTYYQGLQSCGNTASYTDAIGYKHYYAHGELILFDDITLVDNTGNQPTYFLGHDSKVLPLHPGTFSNTLVDSENIIDGPFGWSKSTSQSYRATLASLDKDTNIIYADQPGSINAIVYNNLNKSSNQDTASVWRTEYNDGIGGLKVYNSARKAFLDTDFVNVFRGGITDGAPQSTFLLIHGEENPPIDYSINNNTLSLVGSTNISSESKFGDGSVSFNSNDDLIVLNTEYDIGTGIFTLESWIYFNSIDDQIYLYDRNYRADLSSYTIDGNITGNGYGVLGYSIMSNTGSIYFDISYLSTTTDYEFNVTETPCDYRAKFILPFPSAIPTGEWHHIVLTRFYTNNRQSGWFSVFLDGVSGTGFATSGFPGMSSFFGQGVEGCPGQYNSEFVDGSYIYPLSSNYLDPNSGGYWDTPTGVLLHNLVAKRSYNFNSNLNMPYAYIGGSGLIDDYRFSTGVLRYTEEFTPPTRAFKGPSEDYVQIGPIHNLTRSAYRTFQFYQMDNPDTNLPFTSGEIIRSGLVLGVKKL